MDPDDGALIAVLGSGVPAKAAVTNLLLQIARGHPDGSPAVKVVLLGTFGAGYEQDAPYPLNGLDARDLHPFDSEDAFDEYRGTFGKYIDDMSGDDTGLRTALPAPTWRQVADYVGFMLDLAIVAAGSKVTLEESIGTAIQDIQPTTPDGPATVIFADGTSLEVSLVIRAQDPPCMAGLPVDSPVMLVLMEAHLALSRSGLQFVFARDAAGALAFTIAVGSRRIVVRSLDLPDTELSRHIRKALLPELSPGGGTELWVVTQYSVGEAVPAQFEGEPVKFLPLWQFVSLVGKLKLLGG